MVAALVFVEDSLQNSPDSSVYAYVPSTGLTYKIQPDATSVQTYYSSTEEFFSTSNGYLYVQDGGGTAIDQLVAVSSSGSTILTDDEHGAQIFELQGNFFDAGSETIFTAHSFSVPHLGVTYSDHGGTALFITDGTNAPRVLFNASDIKNISEVGGSYFISASRTDNSKPIGERTVHTNYLIDADGGATLLSLDDWADHPADIGEPFWIIDTFSFQGEKYVTGYYHGSNISSDGIYRIDESNGRLVKTGILNTNSIIESGDNSLIRTFSPGGSSSHFYVWIDDPETVTRDLYRSDGTSEGTVFVGAFDVWPTHVVAIGNRVIFGGFSSQPIMSTDGTAAGTYAITGEGTPAGWLPSAFDEFIVVGNQAFFASASEIYITDGTQNGTRIVFQSPEHLDNGAVELLHAVDGNVYFWATYDDRITDLWVMDGNGLNPTLLSTIGSEDGQNRYNPTSASLVDIPISLLNSSEVLVDPIEGTSGTDNLTGTATTDFLQSMAGDDFIQGLGGNDRMEGGSGQDSLDGGAGEDTAIFSGNRSDYVIFASANGETTVFDTSAGRDGKDTLLNTENIQFADGLVTTTEAIQPPADADNSAYEVYRFFNTLNATHFFTTSVEERNSLISSNSVYQYEGNTFDSNATADNGGTAVFRFYNTENGVHFYTASAEEAANIRNTLPQFNDEGIVYYAHTTAEAGGSALFRFYNTANGSHFFTNSEDERDNIISTLGHYSYEGVAYYVDIA
ncbi:hypothetical protein J7481_11415 [Labrenzia sp. R4_2]|uniref:hypothetical protein n=1 Tax=Labrenzia sp. R4_2 TaxID=2821107 RepID=UPI001ADCC21C|nr:hypothetical protein [Labrenzia sp. R4_2]MBO9420106.1 hypothetical protein [Labrenzia sp. R4_2]